VTDRHTTQLRHTPLGAAWDGLQRLWLENGGNRPDDPAHLIYPCSARDLVVMLKVFGELFEDERFFAVLDAMGDHGVIDFDKGQFRRNFKSPTQREAEANLDQVHYDAVTNMVRLGWSVRHTCAEFAARVPIRANSFDAAVKKVELRYHRVKRKLGK
jgi:hypothetical protein